VVVYFDFANKVTRDNMDNIADLVSVVMSVYDGDDPIYVKESIESILLQTYRCLEFIIVLDGVHRKDIIEVVEQYEGFDKRIIVLNTVENRGLGFAMNMAIMKARGKYIVRMDADDISKVDRIEKLVNYMDSNRSIDISGSYIEEYENDQRLREVQYPMQHREMKRLFLRRNPLAHPSVIFRRSYFDKAGYYPLISIRNEDTLLWLSGFKNSCIFSNVPEVLYRFRINEKTRRRRAGLKKSISDFVDRMRVIIDLNGNLVDVFYALGAIVVQNMPNSIYNIIRMKIISNKTF